MEIRAIVCVILGHSALTACSSGTETGGAGGRSGTGAASSSSHASSSSAAASSGGAGGATSSTAAGGGTTGDTWNNYAKGFFATFCTECHGAGDQLRDYTLLEQVVAEKDKIRCGVSAVMLSGCTISAK